jgi:hypothetical protein
MTQEQKQMWKSDWLGQVQMCMKDAGFTSFSMKEIPNEYCNKSCCSHRAWLLVATHLGIFKIGWRKRVVELDWKDTFCSFGYNFNGNVLFKEHYLPGSKTPATVGDNYIHCWDYEQLTGALRKLREEFALSPPAFTFIKFHHD